MATQKSPIRSWFRRFLIIGLALVASLVTEVADAAETTWLSELDLRQVQQDWGQPGVNKSVDGQTLSIGGRSFTNGLGTHAASELSVELGKRAERFSAWVGVDDEVGKRGSVVFKLLGDTGDLLWQSRELHGGDAAVPVDIAINKVARLTLVVEGGDSIDFDHADWAEARFVMTQGRPVVAPPVVETAVILTPKAAPKPRINSAKVFGVRPGSPFLFTVAATGDRPMSFAVEGLPNGLVLDSRTGRITGNLAQAGEHVVTIRAKNARGEAVQHFKIVCGNQIGLTPAMGWNSWNCFAGAVTAEKVKQAADAMVASGLIDHGWTYVNIDDFWQVHRDSNDPTLRGPQRDGSGRILPNPRFPDMKGLTEYVHGKGLKIGLYSSPGPWTCGGCVGSFDHEQLDAKQYAEWGFDYLKYDWCSYAPAMESSRGDSAKYPAAAKNWGGQNPKARIELMRPYEIMHHALASQSRDMLYSLCQYGMGDVWEWGDQVGGNSWRTTGDITDTWGSLASIGFNQIAGAKFAGPGHFNDPDMLIVGKVGWGPQLHPTRLTPNEQYTHISLWCLLAAPLLIGCDMTQLDDFTLSLLTNDEVLEVDQDPLGRQAVRVKRDGWHEVWAKEMEDGSAVVGLFNRGYGEAPVAVKWSELKISGQHRVRDLWRQQELGNLEESYQALVPRHGVVLVRLWPKR